MTSSTPNPQHRAVVERYSRGEISAAIALMELLILTADADVAAAALADLDDGSPSMAELRRLAAEHAVGCATIATMLRAGLDSPDPAASVEEGIARARRLFDDSVTRSEEASVALYSLGSPTLLAAATEEAVAVLDAWGTLGPQRDALEIGCGIGRFLEALAPRLRSLVGIDVSPKMLEAARRRTAALRNVSLRETSGRNLDAFEASAFDLVYGIDAFPYLVLAGTELVEAHFTGAARVLRPGGDFIIFNYAYGRPREKDAEELRQIAARANLRIIRSDETPFRLWNGIAYHFRRL